VDGIESVVFRSRGNSRGFKHGPAFGEMAAACILGHNQPMPEFSRKNLPPGRKSQDRVHNNGFSHFGKVSIANIA